MFYLKDECYPFTYIDHKRVVVRAILLDEDNKVILEKLIRDDIFLHNEYVETPGGGKGENETLEECLIREIKEELGYEISIIGFLDKVIDYYNLIHRENENYYYLAKVKGKSERHLEEHEKIMFQDELHLTFDEAISLMQKNIGGVGKLVLNRELPILKLAKEKCEELL